MSLQDSYGSSGYPSRDQDLMGFQGDSVFADPMGVQEDKDPGTIMAWIGYFFGGDTQCCCFGYQAKDAELAKKASILGRPPVKEKTNFAGAEPPDKASASNEPSNDRRRNGEPEEDTRGRGRAKERDDPFGRNNRPQQEDSRDAAAAAREKPEEGHLPRKWQWPSWTLQRKEAAIEVYVIDEDCGKSRWCEAETLDRVIDKEGNDAYLCATYCWDGEYYDQDFGPHHVRKRGQAMTVFQLCLDG